MDPHFQYPPPFDNDLLWELYEDDYQTVEDLFQLSLENFEGDVSEIIKAFHLKDLPQFLKSLHKFKPTFGFLGLPQYQEQCKVLEDLCKEKRDIFQVKSEIEKLFNSFEEAHEFIQKTHLQLKAFNTQIL